MDIELEEELKERENMTALKDQLMVDIKKMQSKITSLINDKQKLSLQASVLKVLKYLTFFLTLKKLFTLFDNL